MDKETMQVYEHRGWLVIYTGSPDKRHPIKVFFSRLYDRSCILISNSIPTKYIFSIADAVIDKDESATERIMEEVGFREIALDLSVEFDVFEICIKKGVRL